MNTHSLIFYGRLKFAVRYYLHIHKLISIESCSGLPVPGRCWKFIKFGFTVQFIYKIIMHTRVWRPFTLPWHGEVICRQARTVFPEVFSATSRCSDVAVDVHRQSATTVYCIDWIPTFLFCVTCDLFTVIFISSSSSDFVCFIPSFIFRRPVPTIPPRIPDRPQVPARPNWKLFILENKVKHSVCISSDLKYYLIINH